MKDGKDAARGRLTRALGRSFTLSGDIAIYNTGGTAEVTSV